MQYSTCIFLLFHLSYSFVLDVPTNALTIPKIPKNTSSSVSNNSLSILEVNDFLIEGDADYELNEFDDDDENADYFDGRIVGGSAISIRQFPHQVSLQQNQAHICGGSIMAPNLILTAAHCVEHALNPSMYAVRVGSTQHRHGGQLVRVNRIIRHELYSPLTLDNDVAIIVLAARLSFNQNVKAIAIAKQNDAVPAKKRLLISGWGLTSETGNVMPALRYVSVRLLNVTYCTENYKFFTHITTRMFCAGSYDGGRDSCQGDSGGPLISYVRGKPKLFGVVSWGIGCAQKDFPGVYAKISALRPWINEQIRELRVPKTLEQ